MTGTGGELHRAVQRLWSPLEALLAERDLVIAAIDGRSGSGKTVLAAALRAHAAQALGVPQHEVGLVPIEELYAGWHGLEAAPALLEWAVLAPLRAGQTEVSWPRWDWATSRYGTTGTLRRPATGLVIVEGVGCSAPPARHHLDHVTWVDSPAPLRRRSAAHREQEGGGADTADSWWDQWAAAEERLLATHPPRWDLALHRRENVLEVAA